jgi:S1-C subfamily serine protease
VSAASGRLPAIAGALAALLAALALAACGGDSESEPSEGSEPSTETPRVAIRTQGTFDPRAIYEDASPSVVTVRSVFGSSSALGGAGGQGSGFVISESGEIVTNAHVVTDAETSVSDVSDIQEAEEVYVEFPDRNQVAAKVIGFDPNADVALLQVEPDGLDLRPLELGDSSQVEVGTPVAAIGSPFGQEQSLSTGIISATDRAIESLTKFRIDGALQTDASINPGNSGGPLIDANGDVVGINQQINTTSGGNEGVGFAVPSNLVLRSVEDLRDDGQVEYAYIGVTSTPLYPQLAERLDIDAPHGSLIISTTPGSPAEEAGLRGAGDQTIEFQGQRVEVGGDAIVAIDGEELVSESDLSRLISAHRPGETIEVEIIRDGDRETIDVTLEPRPDQISNG